MSKWTGLTQEALVAAFRENARAHIAHLTVNSRKANAASTRIHEIVGELRRRGTVQGPMSTLLHDPEDEVRVWAARHCLEFAPQDAERVLAELDAAGPGPVGAQASIVLMLLRTGGLIFS